MKLKAKIATALKITVILAVVAGLSSFALDSMTDKQALYQKFLSRFDKLASIEQLRLDANRTWTSQEKNRLLADEFKEFIPTIGIGLGDRFGGFSTHEAEVLAKQSDEFDILIYSMAEYYFPSAKSYYLSVYNKEGKILGRKHIASSGETSFAEITISEGLHIQAKQFKIKDGKEYLNSVETAQITSTGSLKSLTYKSAEEYEADQQIVQD